MIISRTPVRISFFGGGTDYPDYYQRYPGAVLGTTINKYVYVSLNQLSRFFEYKIRVGYSKSELVNDISEVIHPSVRECLRHMEIDGHLDIHIFSDLPAKTGLGSSSAFTVGFLHSLHTLKGQVVSKEQLADEARHIEQKLIPENVGSQDQFHAAFGGMNIIEFDESRIRVRPVIITNQKKKLLDDSMMVFYTGISRFASDVVKEQVDNTKSKSKDTYLNRMYNMVFEAEKIISTASSETVIKNLGELLHESWELKKELSSKVTNSTIDDMYAAARKAGAYGGKISGAGGGGFLTLFVEPAHQESVRRALHSHLEVDFHFEDNGSRIIYLNN
ncbi:MAG: kinase [Deltaproteobacteria bacterium]|nr:MAG: kinase [Deltaproteobacteria bacterium]